MLLYESTISALSPPPELLGLLLAAPPPPNTPEVHSMFRPTQYQTRKNRLTPCVHASRTHCFISCHSNRSSLRAHSLQANRYLSAFAEPSSPPRLIQSAQLVIGSGEHSRDFRSPSQLVESLDKMISPCNQMAAQLICCWIAGQDGDCYQCF